MDINRLDEAEDEKVLICFCLHLPSSITVKKAHPAHPRRKMRDELLYDSSGGHPRMPRGVRGLSQDQQRC